MNKITILSIHTTTPLLGMKVHRMTSLSKHAYAKKHEGVRCETFCDSGIPDRDGQWLKVLYLMSYMYNTEWVWWLDSDATITNLTVQPEVLMACAGDADILICEEADKSYYNTGSFLIRASLEMRRFVQNWWDAAETVENGKYLRSHLNDQSVFNIIVKEGVLSPIPKLKVMPMRFMNSGNQSWATRLGKPQSDVWQPGDFVLHLLGCTNTQRIRELGEEV